MRLRFAVAVACAAALGVAALAHPWRHVAHGTAVVAQSSLRPGGFEIVVRNDSDAAVRLAQVTVNDEFVSFHGGPLVLPAHARTRLIVDYSWVKGEPYEIGVLTSTGDIIDSEVGGAESS
jgi:hypothetical protein